MDTFEFGSQSFMGISDNRSH